MSSAPERLGISEPLQPGTTTEYSPPFDTRLLEQPWSESPERAVVQEGTSDLSDPSDPPLPNMLWDRAVGWLAGSGRDGVRAWWRACAGLRGARCTSDLKTVVLELYRDLARPAFVELVDPCGRPGGSDCRDVPLCLLGRTVGVVRVWLRGLKRVGRGQLFVRMERMAPFAAAILAAGEALPRFVPYDRERRRRIPILDLPQAGGTDPATGLPDACYLEAVLLRALKGRRALPLSLVLIEPVDVNRVRDLQGEVYADAAMALVARAVVGTLRATDPVARIDTNRLAAVLPSADARDARKVVQALSRAISEAGRTASTPQPLTARLGGATAPDDGTTAWALMARAEEELVRGS